jgi:hypothetical protein
MTTARTTARFVRFGSGLMGLVAVGWFLTVYAARPAQQGLPTDWSHRHLVFSRPANADQAARLARDPRYAQQWYRQNISRVLVPNSDDSVSSIAESLYLRGRSKKGLWSEDLGSVGTGAGVGAGIYPAKYSFQVTQATCASQTTPDYVVFSTGLTGASNQASIVGYDNLYTGCTGAVPQTYWAFNTGGQILTSPTISGDGTQIAFVQTNVALEGTLVLLKWAAGGSVGSPVTLTAVSNSAYRNCTAPCMTEIILKNNLGTPVDDETSSVFPDYTNDIIWVGGAFNWLHKITGVFRGTPAAVTTGGFPVQLSSGSSNPLSSPVFDYASNYVFVGDYGGYFYRVNASTAAVTASAELDFGVGIVAGPVVDATSGLVYVFVSSDGSTTCTGSSPCTAVFQFPLGSLATPTEAVVGVSSSTPNPLYDGALDNTYLSSTNATGNLYVCGNTGGAPNLYQIPISAGAMGTVVTGPAISSSSTAACSPVTDIANPNATGGATEWFFASATASGLGNNCSSSGCVMSFKDQQWQPRTTYTRGQQVIDTNFDIQTAHGVPGTSGMTTPKWNTTIGDQTSDGTVVWVNQGPLAAGYASWAPITVYSPNAEIVDSNNNIEFTTIGGLSGTSAPTWGTRVYGITQDGTVQWRNVGAIATSSLAAAGGTSGIIVDNTVGSGTLAGGSQIYFSTQSNQTCTTSGGSGGCAVQASQSALQ